MRNNQIYHHRSSFCFRSHPIIQDLVKEYYEGGNINTNTFGDLLDELEIIETLSHDKCQCRKVVAIILEAANLQKWMNILFSQHESKFHKYSIHIPEQYLQIKQEILRLIQNLQQKMLFTTYQNQVRAAGKLQQQKRRAQHKIENVLRGAVYQQQHHQESEQIPLAALKIQHNSDQQYELELK